MLLVSRDIAALAQSVDRLCVMYAGRVAEIGAVRALFRGPLHPYTRMLLEAIPAPGQRRLPAGIPGQPPSLLNPPSGCRFHPRCPRIMPVCKEVVPELREVEPGRMVACHLYAARSSAVEIEEPISWA